MTDEEMEEIEAAEAYYMEQIKQRDARIKELEARVAELEAAANRYGTPKAFEGIKTL